MTISLDSSAVIDLINNRSEHTRQRFATAMASDEPIVISSIVIHEVMFGALISRRPEEQKGVLESLIHPFSIVPLTIQDAEAAARVRKALRQAGKIIGHMDILVAGQALGRGWTVVTSNARDFRRVEGLKVIDWSAA
ncbi:MAG TPA: type II toxin-antitoxin system VapC family toxin [Caulobacter sp.]|nr:type II toxin-antitoxin system VapC family toxin [Caulobacter sp.]